MALTVILAAIGVLKILNNFSQKMLSFSFPVIIKNTGPCWCGSVWVPSHAPKVRQFYSLLEYIPRLRFDRWSGWCRKQQINVCLSPSPFLSPLKSIKNQIYIYEILPLKKKHITTNQFKKSLFFSLNIKVLDKKLYTRNWQMTNAKSNKKDTIQIATMIMIEAINKTAHIIMVIYRVYIIASRK